LSITDHQICLGTPAKGVRMPRINFNLRVEVLNGLLDPADSKIGSSPIAVSVSMSRIYGNRHTIVVDSALRIALSQVSAAAIVVGIVMLPINFNLFVVVRDGTVKLPKGSERLRTSRELFKLELLTDRRIMVVEMLTS
jgi:hypothetical protein